MPVNTRLQVRKGTAAQWSGVDPVLYYGEMGWEQDTGRVKIGPSGSATQWNSIPYSFITMEDPSNPGSLNGLTTASGISLIGLTGVNGHITGVQIDANLVAGTDMGLSVVNGAIEIAYTGDASLNPNNPDQVEIIQDIVGSGDHVTTGFIRQASGISVVYDDNGEGGSGTLTFGLTGLVGVSGAIANYSTSNNRWEISANLSEGTGIVINDIGGSKEINVGYHVHNITDISGINNPVTALDNSISNLHDISSTGDISAVNLSASNSGTLGYLYVDNSAIVESNLTVGGTIVSSGNVTAPLFIGNLQGTGLSSSGIITNDAGDSSNTHFITFVDDNDSGATNTNNLYTDSAIKYNPSTNLITVSGISANTIETLSNVNVGGDLDVTGTGTIDSNLNVGGNIATTGNVAVGGDLLVKGTTTTVNSTTVDIGDNVIRVNASGLGTGGFEVLVSGTSDYKEFVWNTINDRWEFTGGENDYTSGDISGNTLTSTVSGPSAPLVVTSTGLVSNLNVDLLDDQHGSYYLNFGNATNLPSPTGSGSLSGHISGTMTLDTLDNLGREGDYWSVVFDNTIINNNVIESGMIKDAQIFDKHIASNANIAVTKLASSGITLGSTTVNLGQTSTVIDGLTRISGVSAANPVYMYYAVIDGGTP